MTQAETYTGLPPKQKVLHMHVYEVQDIVQHLDVILQVLLKISVSFFSKELTESWITEASSQAKSGGVCLIL